MFEHYHEWERLLASTQVVLIMLGMGATLTIADFLEVARTPRSLLFGTACQFVLAPVLTLLAIRVFSLAPGIAVGLILISAMPGGPLANLFTFLAKGNIALSIAMTAFATVASMATVPILLRAFADGYVPDRLQVSYAWVIRDIGLFLFVPLMIGMLVLRLAPSISKAFSNWCVRGGLLAMAMIIIGSLGAGRIQPREYSWITPIAIIILCVTIQNASMLPFRLLGWPIPDQTAVGIGVTIRNINLALLMKARLFPAQATGTNAIGDGVLYTLFFWGALSMIVCVPTIFVQPRLMRRQAESAARM